jgi:hypothetical protein
MMLFPHLTHKSKPPSARHWGQIFAHRFKSEFIRAVSCFDPVLPVVFARASAPASGEAFSPKSGAVHEATMLSSLGLLRMQLSEVPKFF